MSPLEWIILASTVGPSVIALVRGVFGAKKMSRAQLVQSGYDLAWSAVEGLKRVRPSLVGNVQAMTDEALDELARWAKALGIKLDRGEVACARMWFEIRSRAAKVDAVKVAKARK